MGVYNDSTNDYSSDSETTTRGPIGFTGAKGEQGSKGDPGMTKEEIKDDIESFLSNMHYVNPFAYLLSADGPKYLRLTSSRSPVNFVHYKRGKNTANNKMYKLQTPFTTTGVTSHLSYNKPKRDKFKETNGHYDASNKKMTNLAHPSETNDAATKQYVDESFLDCLRLDKRKYDIGGRRLTGLILPSDESDAVNKKYVDEETKDLATRDFVEEQIAEVEDNILRSDFASEKFVEDMRDDIMLNMDDLATTKYVDDSIAALQPEQGEEGGEPEFVEKERVDRLEGTIDVVRKDVISLKNKKFVTEAAFNGRHQFFIAHGEHDDDPIAKFSYHNKSSPGFAISKDQTTLVFPNEGVWEITFIDMTRDSSARRVKMIFTNMDVTLTNQELTQVIEKRRKKESGNPSTSQGLYPSELLQL